MKTLVLFSILFSSSFLSTPEDQLLPTKLRITVIDGLGNFVNEASVSIYANEDDYRSSENAIAIATTNEKGKVTFKDLKPIRYFVEAKKGDQNNNGEGVVTGKLAEGRINKVNTVIE